MKQYAVIGLGNFGYYLATHLYSKGNDVLAIDKNPARIQEIKDHVSRAVVTDATDMKALESLGIKEMDAVAICVGTVLSNSILIALNLNDIGVKRLLAMSISEAHGRILKKINRGAEVFFPEKDLAFSLAERLHNPNMLDYLPFSDDYTIAQISPPKSYIGKTLRDVDLINKFGVQIVAVKDSGTDRMIIIPKAKYLIKENDILMILGKHDTLEQLRKVS